MTIMVQNMSTSVSSSSGSGKASAAGQAAAGVSFDSTLAYQMNSSGNSASTASTEVAAKLESLLANYSSETDESLEGLMELLQGLLQELDSMDQALNEDPSLLQELQNWLTQANQLLSELLLKHKETRMEMKCPHWLPVRIRFDLLYRIRLASWHPCSLNPASWI